MDLYYQYKDKIVMEFGAHDHWEDVRVIDAPKKGPYRNIFISTGISPVFGQLPGFSTLELDLDTMEPSNLKVTSLDITKVYGKTSIPPVGQVPYHTMNFADYGIKDLDAKSLAKELNNLQKSTFEK